jgi:hypothetical protein
MVLVSVIETRFAPLRAGLGAASGALAAMRMWGPCAMTIGRIVGLLFAALAVSLAVISYASAQTAGVPLVSPPGQKDCQTIRTCNFARGAAVRGCLSSYSCRSCRFVPRCQTIAGKRVCDQQAQCGWRGV